MSKKLLIFVVSLFGLNSLAYSQETCASNSIVSSTWPSHNHQFFGDGNVYNITTGTVQNFAGVVSYEGVSAASDDQGNLLFFTNGRELWDAAGTLKYNGLLEGDEGGGASSGSAAQGIIIVRHPLVPDEYYIFTTDDVLSPTTYGFNYAVVDAGGNVITPSTRIGTFNTTEGVAATLHANGVDIWITTQQYNSTSFHSYLLTCSGLNTIPVTSNVGLAVTSNQARGGLAFSNDGSMFAQGHANFWPNNEKELQLFDFDNTTGQISNSRDCSPGAASENLYDLTFSPDDSKIYASTTQGRVYEYDVTSGNAATIRASANLLYTPGGAHTSIEMGPSGEIFTSSSGQGFKIYNGSGNGVSTATGQLGLSTRYLPPQEEPDIQEVGPLCDNGAAVDLSTLWICAGSDAEDATDFPNAYSGTGITDAGNGIFNPTTAGPGSHQIIFQRCSVNDTITIQVNNCATACSPPTALAVTPGTLDFCEDDDPTFNVTFSGTATDDYYITWYDNNSTSVEGALTDGTTGAEEYAVTNIKTTQDGTWTVRIEDGNNNDAACYTELTFNVNVNPIPNVTAMTDETICSGDNTTAITLAADVVGSTFNWTTAPTNATGEIASGSGNTIASHTPSNSGSTAGTIVYSVTATANSCTSTPEDVTININPIPTVTTMTDETICSGANTTAIPLAANVTGSTFNWTTTPTNASGEVASGTGASIVSHTPTNTGTTAGSISYSVTATANSCISAAEVVTININPIPTVTAMTDETICSGDNTTAISLAADVTGSTFNWTTTPTNASGEVASGTGSSIVSHSPTNTGTTAGSISYSVTATANSCTSTAEVVTIDINPIPTVSAFTPITICSGTNTGTMTPSSDIVGSLFTWTSNTSDASGEVADETTGASTISDHSPTYTGSGLQGSITYAVSATVNGCTSSPVDHIINIDATPTSNAGTDISICATTATLAADDPSPFSGTWSNIDRGGILGTGPGTITTNSAFNSTFTGLAQGDYSTLEWTVSNGVCPDATSQIDVTVTAGETPTVSIAADQIDFCHGETVDLTTTSNGGGTSPTYEFLMNTTTIQAASATTDYIGSADFTQTTTGNTTYTASVIMVSNSTCLAPGASATVQDDIQITVHAQPTVSVSPLTDNSCGLTPYSLTATATDAASVSWNDNGAGGSFSPADNVVTSYTPSAANGSNYTLEITANGNSTCSAVTTSMDLTVNPGPTVNAGSDITICEGETLDLSTRTTVATASGASSTSWSDGSTGTFSDHSVLSPTYTPPTGVSNITLTLTGNGVAPCAFVDDFITLTIQSLPSANAGSNDLELCQESSTTLGIGQNTSPSYSNAASVNWTVQSGNGSITSGTQNTLNPEYNAVTSDGGNVVTLLMTANPITPCATTATSTVDLSVTAAPTAFAGSSQVICVDDTYTLDGTASVQNTSSYNWSVASGGGTLSNVTSLSPTYSPTSGGQITLSLTAEGENSCPDEVSTVALTVREVDVEIVTDNDVLDIGESTVLSATHSSGGTYESYSWTEASSLDNSTSQTVTASPVITTTYTVTATKDGCSASDELTVSVREPVLVPSMFTPGNSDGLNDNWILTNIEDYPTATIKVYNRWGNIVYKHYGGESYIDIPWDGTKGGDVVPQAVYYYVIDLDYKEIILKGSLTIMR